MRRRPRHVARSQIQAAARVLVLHWPGHLYDVALTCKSGVAGRAPVWARCGCSADANAAQGATGSRLCPFQCAAMQRAARSAPAFAPASSSASQHRPGSDRPCTRRPLRPTCWRLSRRQQSRRQPGAAAAWPGTGSQACSSNVSAGQASLHAQCGWTLRPQAGRTGCRAQGQEGCPAQDEQGRPWPGQAAAVQRRVAACQHRWQLLLQLGQHCIVQRGAHLRPRRLHASTHVDSLAQPAGPSPSCASGCAAAFPSTAC